MKTIGFIGGGNMAGALLTGIIKAGLFDEKDIWVSDVSQERLDDLRTEYGIHVTADNTQVAQNADVLMLSVKPQVMPDVLDGIAGALKEEALVISIAAGITADAIKAKLNNAQVIRVMPNTPALIGAGASGLYNASATEEGLKAAMSILSSVGKAVAVEDEGLMDAITAVSGSGPAYFFLFMEEMIKAGVEMGLTEDTAKLLVLQTAKGAALLAESAQQRGEGPDVLRQKVTSPGGTTQAALETFSTEGFAAMVTKSLQAARDRGRALSK